jgi:DNA-binding NarL/FixJ family response regulator
MFVKDFFPDSTILHASSLGEAEEHIINEGVDLVVMDITIRIDRDMDIIDWFRKLKKNICILIFTGKNKKKYGDIYLKAGANAFLTKRSSKEEYQAVIDQILRDIRSASDSIVNHHPPHPA